MSNNIRYAKKYTRFLNEAYSAKAAAACLEADRSLIREGANAHELVIPRLTADGLADYSRGAGYTRGGVNLSWDTVSFNYERGRMFEVDVLDDAETQGIAFGRLASEFMRTRAIPEADAFKFAQLAAGAGNTEAAAITGGEAAIAAIRAGTAMLDDEDVPYEDRYLFVSHKVKGLIDDLDITKSKAVLDRFVKVVTVPQSRFFDGIELLDGTSEGEEAGGFRKAEGASDLNFLIVHRPSSLIFTKYEVTKIISPDSNPDADAWRYAYRCAGIAEVLPGKAKGIYAHTAV